MPADDTPAPATQDRRKEIFLAVVEAQDGGMAVAPSRTAVAERFGVTEDEVRDIEKEGLARGWPPL
jgi:hypothetical protein